MFCVGLNATVVAKLVATFAAKQKLLSCKLIQRSNTRKCMTMYNVHMSRN